MAAFLLTQAAPAGSRWNANAHESTRAAMYTIASVALLALALILLQRSVIAVRIVEATPPTWMPVDLALNVQQPMRQMPMQQAAASDGQSVAPNAVKPSAMAATADAGTDAMGTGDVGTGTATSQGIGQGEVLDVGSTDAPFNPSEVVDDDEFTAVEHEPSFSMAELYSNMRYPDMARRAGIEGVVLVKVLVAADGSVRRVSVLSSEHPMLNDAAVDGVQALHFTAAVQNGRAVECWLRIPVRFVLN